MKDYIVEVDKTVQLYEPKLAGDYQVLVVDRRGVREMSFINGLYRF